MTGPRIVLSALLSSTLLSGQEAAAGPLAETARSVDKRSDNARSSSSSSSSGGGGSTVDHRDDDSYWESTSSCWNCSGPVYPETQPYRIVWLQPEVDLRLSAQKVLDSDGSFKGSGHLRYGLLGIYLGADHYFETIGDKQRMEEDVKVNLIESSLTARLVDEAAFKADVRFGLGFSTSTHFDPLAGVAFGGQLEAIASPLVSLTAEARTLVLQDEIRVYDGAAGVKLQHMWIGYRAMKFNIGSTLEGPEAGLRFNF